MKGLRLSIIIVTLILLSVYKLGKVTRHIYGYWSGTSRLMDLLRSRCLFG